VKLALIPPLTRLVDTFDQHTHLLLPQLLNDKYYAEYAEEVTRDADEFTILDNGLAEKKQITNAALIVLASYYQPNELVVSDALGDKMLTLLRACSFVRELEKMKEEHPYQGRLAFVVQGQDIADALDCAKRLIDHPELPEAKTLMIPRHLVTPKEPHARLEMAETITKWAGVPLVDIHFLGGSRYNIREVHYAANSEIVRSMDTSLPYVFAMNGVQIGSILPDLPPHRNDDETYWQWEPSGERYEMMTFNVALFRRWAAGDGN
jgi:hypothetical protein